MKIVRSSDFSGQCGWCGKDKEEVTSGTYLCTNPECKVSTIITAKEG